MRYKSIFGKKMIGVFLSIAMLGSSIYLPDQVIAAEDIVISSEDKIVGYDEEINVDININNNIGLLGFGFEIYYDEDYIVPISTSQGDLINNGTYDDSIGTQYSNPYRVVWAGNEIYNSDGKIFTLKLKTLKTGETKLRIVTMKDDTYDNDYNKIELDELNIKLDIICSHSYVENIIKETSCKNQGIAGYTCEKCGNYYEEYIDKLSHDYEIVVTDATCTSDKVTSYKCKNCGYEYTETEKTTGHNYVDNVVAPTCTSKGYTIHKCSICENEYIDSYIDMLEHNYITTKIEADCENQGYDKHICEICGDTYIDNYKDLTGHIWTQAGYLAPTCTEDGHMDGVICSECGKVLVEGATIDALGHNYKNTVIKETCTEDGCTKYVCTFCGDTYETDEVKSTGHNYVLILHRDASSTMVGKDVYKCSKCGLEYTLELPIKESTQSANGNNNNNDSKNNNANNDKNEGVKVGTVLSDKKYTYKVTKTGSKDGKVIGEVMVTGLSDVKITKIKIANQVNIEGVKYNVISVYNKAFKNNKNIVKVYVGKNVKNIGSSAFNNCTNLKNVVIKSKVLKKIGNKVFYKKKGSKIKFVVPKSKKKTYKKLLKKAKTKKWSIK